MIAYIDMVSSCCPEHGNPEFKFGPVRAAIAVEAEDGTIYRSMIALIQRPTEWGWNGQWISHYAGMTQDADACSAADAASRLQTTLEGVTRFVGYMAPFHSKQARILTHCAETRDEELADRLAEMGNWYDPMQEATSRCQIPRTNGRGFKSPKLAEAYSILCGGELPVPESTAWLDVATETLNALRSLHWMFEGRGEAPPIAMSAPVAAAI